MMQSDLIRLLGILCDETCPVIVLSIQESSIIFAEK